MKGYYGKIENLTVENENFRKVLYTGQHSQLVLMSIVPNGEIGAEVHADNDQFFRFESGHGKVIIDDNEYPVEDGDAIIVPVAQITTSLTLLTARRSSSTRSTRHHITRIKSFEKLERKPRRTTKNSTESPLNNFQFSKKTRVFCERAFFVFRISCGLFSKNLAKNSFLHVPFKTSSGAAF